MLNRALTTTPGELPGVIALVGQPNVGKSSLFQVITGRLVMVANYPGTTVEVAEAAASFRPDLVVVDTPGLLTLPSRSPGEEVTVRLLLERRVTALVQVADTKNLRRTLLLATQFAELGIPMVLALNMADEAEERGLRVDHQRLSAHLSMPVTPTVATTGRGTDELTAMVAEARVPAFRLTYPSPIENALAAIAVAVGGASFSPRAIGLLWLAGDPVIERWVAEHADSDVFAALQEERYRLQLGYAQPLSAVLHATRLEFVDGVVGSAVQEVPEQGASWLARLGRACAHPLWGLPVLAAVLIVLYLFVGVLGASVLVDGIEEGVFADVVNPRVTEWVQNLVPVGLLAEFLVGEYGLWTMGMTYALALILPIVTTFFIAFSLLEDTGYIPRLSVLTNRIFRTMGLNGRAVVPMVLGLGCVTMATLTTRILETKRERLLVILLLALAVPCSAQLGVVMGLLAGVSFAATLLWAGTVVVVLLAVGWLAARLLPGDRQALLVELPPMRRPRLAGVVLKTVARVEWYLKEVVPIFLAGTAVLFFLDRLHVLAVLMDVGEPLVVGWMGLPAAATTAFLMGFLRRDFGAAGLFALATAGTLSSTQLVVAMVTITLFVPCIASVFMIARERNWATAGGMVLVVFPMAFVVGGLLSRGLTLVGWS